MYSLIWPRTTILVRPRTSTWSMTRLRFSGRYLVSASCGSYMWLSASNTGKESSRDGMAISLKSGFPRGGNDVTPFFQGAVIGRSGRRPVGRQLGGRAVDDGEVHRRRGDQRLVALFVAQDVDLHDHRAPTLAQHPWHCVGRPLSDRS